LVSYTQIIEPCKHPIGNFFSPTTGEVKQAPCCKWSCAACGPRRARRYVARVSRMPARGYFITLTARPHGPVDAETVKSFNRCYRHWRQWLKRECGVGHSSWVLEKGERTGHLHRHAVIETFRSFSYRRARASLVRCGLGVVCDFKRISSKRGASPAARYLGKYLGKHLSNSANWPRFARRCQTSVPDNTIRTHSWSFIARPKWDVPAQRLKRSRFEFAERATEGYWNDVAEEDGLDHTIALNQYDKLLHGGNNYALLEKQLPP
jgi:hypothetical protein